MDRVLKKRNIIAALFLALLCFVAGLFFYEKKEADVVTANAAEAIPYIEGFDIETITLSTTPEYYKLRLGVNITLDMYIKLRNEGMNYLAVEVVNPDDPEETKQWYYYAKDNAYFYPEKIEIYDEEVENVENFEDLVNWTKPIKIYIPVDMPNNLQKAYKFRVYWFKLVNDWKGYSLLGGTDITNINVSKVAQTYLDTLYDKMTDEEIEWFNHLAGYEVQDETFTLNLEYKEVAEFGRIETVTEQYQVDSHLVGVASRIYDTVMNLKGVRSLKEFNAIYKNPDGSPERIILQADGYTYSFDNTSGTGVLKIEYLDFKYKDFAIRVQDNDIHDNVNLYHYIWATKITEKSNGITIHFEFSEIVKKCFNDLGWIFSLSAENFSVVNNSNIADSRIRLNQAGIYITFFESQQDELQNISILGIAEIIEDFSCDVTVKYSALSFENGTIVETQENEKLSIMYSSYIQLSNFTTFKESVVWKKVTSALQVAELKGQEFFIPYNLEAKKNTDGSFTLSVVYSYNTLLQITNIGNGKVHYVACTLNSATYNINALGIAAPAGYRIRSLSSEDPSVTITFDEGNTSQLSVTVNTNTKAKKIIPIQISYSDSWYINIVYKDTYKDTPFAIEKEELVEFKVGQYDPKNLTISDVKKLLGRSDDMKICGISIPEKYVATEITSDSTYRAIVSYGVCSLKQIDYNGYSSEIRVPLTSYDAWCKSFGDDMTILMLNTTEDIYFKYSNEVDREKLYGFFSVAIFEEQVTDLNYWFRSMTGDGNVVVFEQRETIGSDIYKFFDRLAEKNSLVSVYGYVGMMYCEIINDENHKQHSVFFFMDATSGYVSDGGAEDRDDTDGAFKNTMQDVAEKFGEWLDGISESMNSARIAIMAVLGVALAGAVAFGVIWLIKYYKKE